MHQKQEQARSNAGQIDVYISLQQDNMTKWWSITVAQIFAHFLKQNMEPSLQELKHGRTK